MKKVEVTVITAHKLTASQKQTVLSSLEAKLGLVTLKESIDPSVIGGLKIQLGSQVFDASVAGKLEKLESVVPDIQVITAVELTAAQKSKIKAAVEQKYGSATITEQVDHTIIGGIKIIAGSKEYDATIKGKLARLKQQLLQTI